MCTGHMHAHMPPMAISAGVTLVVSPLLALMRDQLANLPQGVPGAMLWGGQTRAEAESVLGGAARGAVKVRCHAQGVPGAMLWGGQTRAEAETVLGGTGVRSKTV